MTTPIIETPRMILRPLKISDAEAAYNNWTSDPEVTKYVRWNTHQSINETVEWLTFEENCVEHNDLFSWGFVYRESNELIGSGGLIFDGESQIFEIGYIIMKKYWNMGVATEVSSAFIDFAVRKLNQTSFLGRHAKENPASGRVMEKLSFVYKKDEEYSSFDGKRIFECRKYILMI